jgi:hypothetical protein
VAAKGPYFGIGGAINSNGGIMLSKPRGAIFSSHARAPASRSGTAEDAELSRWTGVFAPGLGLEAEKTAKNKANPARTVQKPLATYLIGPLDVSSS